MSRKAVQIVVLVAVFILVGVVTWFQYYHGQRLQTSVLGPYGYSGFATQTVYSGYPVYTYRVPAGSLFVLDGLQSPELTTLSENIMWASPSGISVNDNRSVQTDFVIPGSAQMLRFELKKWHTGAYRIVAYFDVDVWSTGMMAIDANHDFRYTFVDLVDLLQNWDRYGGGAVTILATLLSRYEGPL
ncbi:MAG: hypothetical protein Q8P95_04700 [bacterium]|nr:hypothetical protein [bacterium]